MDNRKVFKHDSFLLLFQKLVKYNILITMGKAKGKKTLEEPIYKTILEDYDLFLGEQILKE